MNSLTPSSPPRSPRLLQHSPLPGPRRFFTGNRYSDTGRRFSPGNRRKKDNRRVSIATPPADGRMRGRSRRVRPAPVLPQLRRLRHRRASGSRRSGKLTFLVARERRNPMHFKSRLAKPNRIIFLENAEESLANSSSAFGPN